MAETPMLIPALAICSVLTGLILVHAVMDVILRAAHARETHHD